MVPERLMTDRAALASLCRAHHVRRLDLFGSAADGRFKPGLSDLDFLVEFQELPPAQYADAYFGLLDGLKSMFGVEVDLVVARAIRNRYFAEAVNKTRTLVYAA